MLSKILAFWQGYVILFVWGGNPEEFFSLAVKEGVFFWDLRRFPEGLTVKVPALFLKKLRGIARASGCRFQIQEKQGLPFLCFYLRKRRLFGAGALFFCAFLYLASSLLWFVEVEAVGNACFISPKEILTVAAEKGLKRGVLKAGFDPATVTSALLAAFPSLAWVGIEVRGTKAKIKFTEQLLPPPKANGENPANIVATKDGVIEEILVFTGEARVKVGDTVQEGEVLISGEIQPQGTEGVPGQEKPSPLYVRAQGIVKARVWYEGEGEATFLIEEKEPTGRVAKAFLLFKGGKEFCLWGSCVSPYPVFQEERKVLFTPRGIFKETVSLFKITYTELEKKERFLTFEEAYQKAVAVASELLPPLPAGARVLTQREEVLTRDHRGIRVRVLWEVLEEIGVSFPLPLEKKSKGEYNKVTKVKRGFLNSIGRYL